MLEHGGKLVAAATKYGLPLDQWIDLSTGISPVPYLVPAIEADVWRRLPEEQDGLLEAARSYYSASQLLAVSGSQAAIKSLPFLRTRSTVALVDPSYNEHAHAWLQSGHKVVTIDYEQLEMASAEVDVLVVCNPNNPTGSFSSSKKLKTCLDQLSARGGWLVVDEAFIDCDATESMIKFAGLPGLIILRSLGKFFGLAGARVGFVSAEQKLLSALGEHLGPWTISGPSRAVAKAALSDTAWQAGNRNYLRASSERLSILLRKFGLTPAGSSAYFQWVMHPEAELIHHKLAESAILTRYFSTPASIRFGLPGLQPSWSRLEQALVRICM